MQKINEDSVEKVEITNDRLTANVKLKNEENSVRVVTVSYTHLDVYKRQSNYNFNWNVIF